MSEFTGRELLRVWQAAKPHGVSQRKLADLLGVNFNAMHGKLFRAQQENVGGSTLTKHKTYEPVGLKAAVFDIETADFTTGGYRDYMICGCILPLDQKEPMYVNKLKFEESLDDRRLMAEYVTEMRRYDILIGHNIAGFDFNWLNSRAMYHGVGPMGKRWMYYDTYQASKRLAIKADRKSMVFLADFFRLKYIKTSVMPVSWGMMDSRNKDEFTEALADIVYHCEQDVLTNRQLFDALWARDTGLTNLPLTRKW